jgi:hypothetical protein
LALFGLMAPLTGAVQAADEFPADRPVSGATVAVSEAAPPPGRPARVRVRGAALTALLAAGDNWHLSAGGEPQIAVLQAPAVPAEPEPVQLTLVRQSDPAAGTLEAVLDRGLAPEPLDHLRLYFASLHVLGLASLASSDDDETYTACGEPQVVWQDIQGGTVLRLTEIVCQPGTARYLRLRLPAAGGARLDHAEGWLAPEDTRTLYEVPAALGAMRETNSAGEHLWPLELPDNGLALAKLKVIASAPGAVRRISVVRLQQDGQSYTTAGEALWVDGLKAGGKQRTQKWIEVSDSGTERPWAVVVADEGFDPLPVSGVQAYAAEYWLYFTMPEARPLELWLAPALSTPEPALALGIDAVYAGEVSELDLRHVPAPEAPPSLTRDWLDRLDPLLSRWGRLSAFALGGLVLLIIGLLLTRRPPPDGEAD